MKERWLLELIRGEDMIARIIKEHAPYLEAPPQLNKEALLWAVYGCEHYTKKYFEPRFEPAYAPGGIYFRNSGAVREEHEKWGRSASCSYSNFQILYITATELGYSGPPLGLDRDSLAIPFVIKYINERIFTKPGSETVEQVADGYNSGTHLDRLKPIKYMARFRRYYDKSIRKQNA
jgi:hypothetical protein